MKKIAIMQPYLFPYIGYWQLLDAVDEFLILDDVQYIHRGWINRNRILINNHESLFTFSLKNDSRTKKINERLFSSEFEREKAKFLRSLQLSYSKAPFFAETFAVIEKSLNFRGRNIAVEIGENIRIISEYLGLKTSIGMASNISCNKKLKGQDNILELNKAVHSNCYFNLAGGMDLYSKNTFLQNGIDLCFIKNDDIVYRQFIDPFVPNLSIIDVMMFNSRDEINGIMKRYRLL